VETSKFWLTEVEPEGECSEGSSPICPWTVKRMSKYARRAVNGFVGYSPGLPTRLTPIIRIRVFRWPINTYVSWELYDCQDYRSCGDAYKKGHIR